MQNSKIHLKRSAIELVLRKVRRVQTTACTLNIRLETMRRTSINELYLDADC